MFNENPGTCVLMRSGGSTVVHPFVFCLFCFFGKGCPLERISQICLCFFFFFFKRGSAAHKSCRTGPCRLCLPRRSDAEIFIGCLFCLFFPPEKKDRFKFSNQTRLCVWFKFFISELLCSQCEFHTVGRERGGEDGVVFGLCFVRGECKWRDVFSFILN